jgi:transcriptional regulator with XRE-family HTH domain
MEDIVKCVGQNTRKLRLRKKRSQEQLAIEANLQRAYIGQIERGEQNIGLPNPQKIADAPKVSVKRLV